MTPGLARLWLVRAFDLTIWPLRVMTWSLDAIFFIFFQSKKKTKEKKIACIDVCLFIFHLHEVTNTKGVV
jgi:hypothetical protein